MTDNNFYYYYYDKYPSHMPDYLKNLTYNLSTFYTIYKNGCSPSHAEHIFWDDIYTLIHDPQKQNILKKWKYGNSFILTEKIHENKESIFGSHLNYPQRFIIELLMFEFK